MTIQDQIEALKNTIVLEITNGATNKNTLCGSKKTKSEGILNMCSKSI